MRETLLCMVRQPSTGAQLELAIFEQSTMPDGSVDVREGVLFDSDGRSAYPIVSGVPLMLDGQFSREFLRRHEAAIRQVPKLSALTIREGRAEDWSFSREWREHVDNDSARTWGYTASERLEQFLMETQTGAADLVDLTVLDAGCGNGALCRQIASLGAEVVGIDYSSSVVDAERLFGSAKTHFARGDLQKPPFAEETFDIVIAIGVLHHTPDTLTTFRNVARLVKPGGKFYVWLYRRPEGFIGRSIKVPIYDVLRFVGSRLPASLQAPVVRGYARIIRGFHRIRLGGNVVPLKEYLVSAYDDLTPTWRHYHNPLEVSRWFFECGFGAPVLSHWDNPYGFGLVAVRGRQTATPGVHYGTGVKLWDDSQTLLGRLHS